MAEVTIESLQARLDKAVEVFKQMKAEMADKDAQIKELTSQRSWQDEDADNAQNRIEELEKTVESKDLFIKQLQDTYNEVFNENQKLREATSTENVFDISVYEKLLADYNTLEGTNKILEAQINEINDIRTKQVNAYKELKENHDKLQTSYEEVCQLASSLTEDNKKITNDLKELQSTTAEFSKSYAEMQDSYTFLKGTYEMIQQEYDKVKNELSYTKVAIADSNKTIEELNTEVAGLNHELDTLQEKYDKYQKSYSEVHQMFTEAVDEKTNIINSIKEVIQKGEQHVAHKVNRDVFALQNTSIKL